MPIINKSKPLEDQPEPPKSQTEPPKYPASPITNHKKTIQLLTLFLIVFCLSLTGYFLIALFYSDIDIPIITTPTNEEESAEAKRIKRLANDLLNDINRNQRFYKEYKHFESAYNAAQQKSHDINSINLLKSGTDKAKAEFEDSIEQIKTHLMQLVQSTRDNQTEVLSSVESLAATEKNETNKLLLQRLKGILPAATTKTDISQELDQLLAN